MNGIQGSVGNTGGGAIRRLVSWLFALLFAVAWGIICLRSLRRGWRGVSTDRGLYFGFFLAFGGMAAFSLTDHVLFNIQVTAVFWSIMAAVAVSERALTTNKTRVWLRKKFRGLAGFF